jgi:hypothetical protein
MQWSRLRSSVRERLAPTVAKRVDVHMASYGASSLDRAWLTLDGRDILTLPEYMTWQRVDLIDRDRLAPHDPQSVLFHEGRIATIGALLHRSLEMPFEALVTSPTVFLRGFARFDRRFGKRRLAAPLPVDEHPFVVHCHAFRAAAEGISCPESPPPADDARWHRMPVRGPLFSPAAIAAADKTLAERKPKPFAALVRRCRESTDIPVSNRWERDLRATLAARSPTAAHRLVAELIDIAAATTIDEAPQLAAGLVALLSHESPRVRDLADWRPATHNAERQFASLARHLFARHDLPRFLDRAWTEGSPREQAWFVHLGAGNSLRTAADLPLPVSRAIGHWFLQSPDDCPVEAAFRHAQVRALGGDATLAEAVRRTRLGHDYSHGAFWEEVIRFFVANPLLDRAQVGPIVDWLQAQRFEPEIAPGAVLPEAGALPPRPALSMHGRTVAATLREVEAWHRRLGRATAAPAAASWTPSGIDPFDFVAGVDPKHSHSWRIREITSGDGLVREGARMEHCVASYAASCAAKRSSIWTMERTADGTTSACVTIEVHLGSRRIGQVRGKRNRAAGPEELSIIRRWAERAELMLDVVPRG